MGSRQTPPEQECDGTRPEAIQKREPWWYALIGPLLIALLPMAVGGLALTWRDSAVTNANYVKLEGRVSGIEARERLYREGDLLDRYTGTEADRDWNEQKDINKGLIFRIDKNTSDIHDVKIDNAKAHPIRP